MAAGTQEWVGVDVLMMWEMEEARAALEEYEAAQRLKRGSRWALLLVSPFWLAVGPVDLAVGTMTA